MKCEQAEKLVSVEFDGELTPDRLGALQTHISACARCRQFRQRLRRGNDVLGELAATDLRTGFATRFLERLPESASGGGLGEWRLAIRPARAVAAAVGLAVGVGLALMMNGGTGTPPADSVVAVNDDLPRLFSAVPGEFAGAKYLALFTPEGE